MNNNFFNFLRMASNPNDAINNILKQNMNNNPLLNNVYNLSQSGDTKKLEIIARNLCKEKGLDIDKISNQIKQNIGK